MIMEIELYFVEKSYIIDGQLGFTFFSGLPF